MSASGPPGSRAALKAIKSAIQAKKYDEAVQQAQAVLKNNAQDYQAWIFLGFAHDRQGNLVEAERAYDAAIKSKAADAQAWQGLIETYVKQGPTRIAEYQKAALSLALIYQDADDKFRCQDVVDKFVDYARSHGTRQQHRQALELILPTSPIYEYLEGRVPHPAHTYQIIAQIVEFEEKERINKEIGERRTRLGARIAQVTTEVKRDVFLHSELEILFQHVIDWANDDDIRRQYEEKLLRHCLECVEVLQDGKRREEQRAKTQKLAADMVIIKHPYKLAWDTHLEWQDVKEISSLDATVLQDYITFFPSSGLAQILRGYMTSEISPFPVSEAPSGHGMASGDLGNDDDDDDDDGGVKLDDHLSAEDRLITMTEGMSESSRSLLAHRIMGEFYQSLSEHESVVDLMRNAQRLYRDESVRLGHSFDNSLYHVKSLLATALVFYQSPKNHPEAKTLFHELLQVDPMMPSALIGTGLIYEEEEDFPSALQALSQAVERDPNSIRVRVEYLWVKAVVEGYLDGAATLQSCLPLVSLKDASSKTLLAKIHFRIGMCIWHAENSKEARSDRKGAYSHFLASLKSDLNYSPAYTMLGLFYADYARDRKRARKCFQKAFEISAAEIESAERLAKDLALQREWEAVEAIAQRVVDAGKAKAAPGAKRKGHSWPYAALGVSHLNKQDYAKSAASFQAALRIKPDDYHSWIGLGESYHQLGRYTAASRTFKHAEQFTTASSGAPGDTWYARHMLGNVNRELGEYEASINEYKSILVERPQEFGVAIALLGSMVHYAWDCSDKDQAGRAAALAAEAIEFAAKMRSSCAASFNFWKDVADACAVFRQSQSHLDMFPSHSMLEILSAATDNDADKLFAETDRVDAKSLDSKIDSGEILQACVNASILCHKQAVQLTANDVHARAVALYNLGWAEFEASKCFEEVTKRSLSSQYVKASVLCFKQAIELEAKNAEFWNSLGVVTSRVGPRVAQHAFIRSLHLDEHNAAVWTNLGALYLLHHDYELAAAAFTRAQSADPEYAHAWIGHAYIAQLTGDEGHAESLFVHAMNINEKSSPLTKRHFAQTVFDQMMRGREASVSADLPALQYTLARLQSGSPHANIEHLLALSLERGADANAMADVAAKLCAQLEADYEVTESPMSLARFAIAKTDLSRARLHLGALLEPLIEDADSAVQLSQETNVECMSVQARDRCQLSAYLVLALSHHRHGDTKQAVESMQRACKIANSDPDVVCLLAQILWTSSDEDERARARDLLFENIESHSQHVQSVLCLGTMALLDDDAESLDAVLAELSTLRMSGHATSTKLDMIDAFLHANAACCQQQQQQQDASRLREVQTSIMLRPARMHCWQALGRHDDAAAATGGGGNGGGGAASMGVEAGLATVTPTGDVDAAQLAAMLRTTGVVERLQRAVVLAPWMGSDLKGDLVVDGCGA